MLAEVFRSRHLHLRCYPLALCTRRVDTLDNSVLWFSTYQLICSAFGGALYPGVGAMSLEAEVRAPSSRDPYAGACDLEGPGYTLSEAG